MPRQSTAVGVMRLEFFDRHQTDLRQRRIDRRPRMPFAQNNSRAIFVPPLKRARLDELTVKDGNDVRYRQRRAHVRSVRYVRHLERVPPDPPRQFFTPQNTAPHSSHRPAYNLNHIINHLVGHARVQPNPKCVAHYPIGVLERADHSIVLTPPPTEKIEARMLDQIAREKHARLNVFPFDTFNDRRPIDPFATRQ